MQEQYITDRCLNKLNELVDNLRFINPSFIISTTMKGVEGDYYYSLFIRRAGITGQAQVTFAEYWLYTEPMYKLLGRTVYEICNVFRW
jgi:hypothetical protein